MAVLLKGRETYLNLSVIKTNTNPITHIDPRVKMIHTLIVGVLLFIVRSNEGGLLNAAFMAMILIYFGLYNCALKLMLYTIGLYALMQLLNFIGGAAMIIGVTVYIFFKFSPVLGIYYMMTKSISVSEFVNALEKIKLPRSITITLAVTLRFMPTIGQEMSTIKESMKTRNIPLNLWNVLKSPIMMMEFVMVPLMMRFVRVAEELAAAAVVRGIERPGQRGSMFEIKLRLQDFIYLFVVILFAVFLYCFERGVIR
ncbi:energy-coupling factor transporter transmembrane component T [Tissierella sp.]|uniref:energy-coupling factor transporter transmembrane component T n=1 Tax=Tissierella sp. TaxID=41274 RepID=UPI0028A8F952|nr:energy-coupling factor transporter transmembrane component T [Tissierella sp.]